MGSSAWNIFKAHLGTFTQKGMLTTNGMTLKRKIFHKKKYNQFLSKTVMHSAIVDANGIVVVLELVILEDRIS